MKKEVYFYFDVINNPGFGHYSRCSVLNSHLKKRKIKTFLLLLKDINLNKFKEFDVYKYKNLNLQKKRNILIIDDYKISSNKILLLKKYFNYIFYIEDHPSKKKNINAIINSNYRIKEKYYDKKKKIKYFLGTDYKLIREIKVKNKNKNKKGLTLSFGGGEVFNRIKKILDLTLSHLINLNYKKQIDIFINLNKNQKKFFKKFENLKINIKKPSSEYYKKLLNSHFCISTLGVQHDEILKKKIPAIFLKIDTNQKYNFEISKRINSDFTFDTKKLNKDNFLKALNRINRKKNRIKIIKNYKKIKMGNKVYKIINFILDRMA
jgi:spore coat polysaccharide biosynthesis predicted glycosyltransferase SpsG